MKTYSYFLIILLLSLITNLAQAEKLVPSHYPAALMFSNKPIDPLCFYNVENHADKIRLSTCGIQKNKYSVSGTSDLLIKKDFYGFEWKDIAANYPAGGYSYYQAWDAGNHQYWLYTVNNGGGSGDFTAVNLYSRDNTDTASLKTIASGDRCNGGVDNVQTKDSHLRYSVNITAYDLLELANDNPHNLKPYTDLSACAVCCVAKAYYDVDKQLKPQLTYIDLGEIKKANEMPMQGTYHDCFNRLMISYASKNKNKLDAMQLKNFVKTFNATCVK